MDVRRGGQESWVTDIDRLTLLGMLSPENQRIFTDRRWVVLERSFGRTDGWTRASRICDRRGHPSLPRSLACPSDRLLKAQGIVPSCFSSSSEPKETASDSHSEDFSLCVSVGFLCFSAQDRLPAQGRDGRSRT